ncbi:MAG: hypothetical protein LCH92_13275 [Proteobacteria bacterium]|nr:hypothetical protein [Pseudomonadota bacterium]
MIQQMRHQAAGPILQPVSALAALVHRALRDLKPLTRVSEARTAAIAEQCGPAEIEAAIVWLDDLARDRREVQDWDRTALNEILRLQDLLHGILCRVPCDHFDAVAAGLKSPEWRTRIHVAMALDALDRRAALPHLRKALAREQDDQAGQVLVLTLARAESEGV